MKNKKSYVYIGLPVLGMIFYLAYIRRSAIDMVYSDYIRLINSYLPDVWNPDKFFVADLLTRIPVNFLERGLNVMIFGYSVTVDRIMGILGFGLSALVIGRYSRKKELCPVWYAAMRISWHSDCFSGIMPCWIRCTKRDSETRRNRSLYFSLYCRL